jgi:broad specificity phosphatase PhoE
MARLLLVRHGESTWNARGRWQGWADPPLSELGRAQAEAAAPAAAPVDAVVSSDLQRALTTAELMAAVLEIDAVHVEPGLRERDVGDYTGLTRAEIEERWPGALSQGNASIARNPTDTRFGESIEQLAARVNDAIARVAGSFPGQRVLVITHGGVVRNLERSFGIEPDPLPNLAGRQATVDPETGVVELGERVLLLSPEDVPVTVPKQL